MCPENGTVAVDECIQVTVDFCPVTSGEHKNDLVLHYDSGLACVMLSKCIAATLITSTLFKVISAFTSLNVSFTRKISSFQFTTGEDIFIQLYGISIDANVRLDKNSMRIENTYLSMANQRTVTITNRSDVIAHFRWTQYATQEEEDQQKLLLASL